MRVAQLDCRIEEFQRELLALIDRYCAMAAFPRWVVSRARSSLGSSDVPIPLGETGAAFPLEPTHIRVRAGSAGQGRQ